MIIAIFYSNILKLKDNEFSRFCASKWPLTMGNTRHFHVMKNYIVSFLSTHKTIYAKQRTPSFVVFCGLL